MKLRDQLNQMQTLMEQLVKMVGHNNAVTEELRQQMDGLETKVDNQGIRLDRLETKVDRLEIIQMITILGKKVDKIDATQALQSEMLRKLAADTAQHEAEITLLKRAK